MTLIPKSDEHCAIRFADHTIIARGTHMAMDELVERLNQFGPHTHGLRYGGGAVGEKFSK